MYQIFFAAVLPWFRLRSIAVATAVAATTRRGRLFLLLAIFSLLASPAFSSRLISPVQGRFANKQCLVLRLEEGEEAFYSYTSTNPLAQGFAYDGPVLIDMAGEVSLSIAVLKGNQKEEIKINYSVSERGNPFATGTAEKDFIDRINLEGILPCAGDSVINIPKSLSYFIGDGEKPVMQGQSLSVSADNKLSRYIPCTVTDGNYSWRFIIFLSSAVESTSFAKNTIPFEIYDWENLTFTGKNLIWCLDDGIWSASTDSIVIDRSKEHVLYWQDVAYKAGNPVEKFVIPPKPLLRQENFNKALAFSIDGDLRYRMSVVTSGTGDEAFQDSSLYPSVTFDTFEGDVVRAKAIFAFFCDGVYQGEIASSYIIDRQPPLPPKFIASEPGEYARHDVSLSVESESGAKIYLSLLGPFTVNSNSYLDNNSEFDYIKPGEFFLYKSQPLELRAGLERTVCYRAFAYAEDSSGNVSKLSNYKVIIDEYNYFIDAQAADFAADGSRLHPFNSFDQVLKIINQGKFVHFFVSGSIRLPKGLSLITSNCSFTGMKDAQLILPASSYILLRGASFEVQNCLIQKNIEEGCPSDQRLLVLEKSAAIFDECELLASFDSSGTLISADSSIVSFNNSGLTAQATAYACDISSTKSKIFFTKSHASSIADTAVNFSVKASSFDLKSSDCRVISHLGRIVEASESNLRLNGNKYTGDFDREQRNVEPVWKDEKSLFLEDKNNLASGF